MTFQTKYSYKFCPSSSNLIFFILLSKRFYRLSRNSSLWTRVDLSSLQIGSTEVKRFLKQNLIGSFTLDLAIRFQDDLQNIQKYLHPLLKICTNLQRLRLFSGHADHFMSLYEILPLTIRHLQLTMVGIRNSDSSKLNKSPAKLVGLEHLSIVRCSWFSDAHLNHLLHSHPCRNLVHLDLGGCYRLFGGAPAYLNLGTRIGLLIRFLDKTCSHLRFLGLRSVFNCLSHVEQSGPVSTVSSMFDSTPLLETIDLSCNSGLSHHICYSDSSASSFLQSLFSPSRLAGRTKSKFTLYLRDWPTACVSRIIRACTETLDERSTLTLVANIYPEPVIPPKSHVILVNQVSERTTGRRATSRTADEPEQKKTKSQEL
ncbi:unnamed protein product [Calicophoron daubneyi]|uniref:Uncharacterized protein n=1 Tax=Calicophoron daubneyi TaxID=300641 RepID=A0AAV2TNC4_CALDB